MVIHNGASVFDAEDAEKTPRIFDADLRGFSRIFFLTVSIRVNLCRKLIKIYQFFTETLLNYITSASIRNKIGLD